MNPETKIINKNYFTHIQMRQALENIMQQISQSDQMPQIVLGINRGGCIPGIYLSHRLNVPHVTLNVALRDHNIKPDLSALEKAYAWQKKILVVDDINDTGSTFNYILENFGKPDRLKFGVLLHNIHSECQQLDYKGYDIDKVKDPRWIVFPWEQW